MSEPPKSPFRNGSRRLPSFKGQRDLTLGSGSVTANKSSTSKKFVPNLNVRRKTSKPEDESTSKTPTSHKNKDSAASPRDKRRQPSKKPDLIQIGSVFSEGSVPTERKYRGSTSSKSNDLNLPRLKIPKDEKFGDGEDDKERLQKLLRDDFVGDVKVGGAAPVQLPMIRTGEIYKDEPIIKAEPGEEDTVTKKKPFNRIYDDDDVKILNNFKDFVSSTESSELFLVQLPDVLPEDKCINDINEGLVGKIQVRKSGQTRLILGTGDELDVEMGTQVGFLQEAMSVRLNERPPEEEGTSPNVSSPSVGDMTFLGKVLNRLVITPSWETLLKKSGNEDDS